MVGECRLLRAKPLRGAVINVVEVRQRGSWSQVSSQVSGLGVELRGVDRQLWLHRASCSERGCMLQGVHLGNALVWRQGLILS